MKRVFGRRPSASMIVSLTALVVAMSGTAVAAGVTMYNGNKIIKKHSLSGNRLTYKSVTGYAIKLSKLGTVPTASYANAANDANFASNAGNADSAGTATNATNATNVNTIKTWYATASAGQTAVPLLAIGPFTITGNCSGTSSDPSAQTQVSTSQNNSELNSYEGQSATPFNTGATEDIGGSTSGTNGWEGPDDGSDAMISGDGNTYANTFASVGTLDGNGAQCTFAGYATVTTR